MADNEAAIAAPIIFKKGKAGKRRQRTKRADDDSDDGDGDAVIKQRAKQLKGAIVVSSKPEGSGKNVDDVYVGRGEIRDRSDMGATRILEEETELHRDRRAQREAFMNDAENADGTYKGMQGYKDWKQVRLVRCCLHVLLPYGPSCVPILRSHGINAAPEPLQIIMVNDMHLSLYRAFVGKTKFQYMDPKGSLNSCGQPSG